MSRPKKKPGRGRSWLGGYCRRESNGALTFIIEKRVGKRRFHVSTRCTDEASALEHYARFQANPLQYDPAGVEPDEPLLLSVELIVRWFNWSLEKGNGLRYAKEGVRFMRGWGEELRGKDLRKLTLARDIKPALAKWKTSRQARIIALKSFYGWLRKEAGVLVSAQDPTLDLPVPQANPEKNRRRKAVDWSVVKDLYPYLKPRVQDLLQFFVATGWHISEVERFIRREDCTIEKPGVPTLSSEGRPVLAVLVTWHKTKKWTRTSLVHQRHLDAITRLKASGKVPRKINDAVAEALKMADAKRREFDPAHVDRKPFHFGVMRHSVATWGIELGATVAEAAVHLDHADKSTTDRFYADVLVPRPPIPTRVLGEAEDRTLN